LDILTRDYYAIQAAEDISNEVMSDLLLGKRLPEVTVFIPSVVTEYRSFWHSLVSAGSRDCRTNTGQTDRKSSVAASAIQK